METIEQIRSRLQALQEEQEMLNTQLAMAEKKVQLMSLLPIVEEGAMKMLPSCGIAGKVVIVLEYDEGELSRVGITQKYGLIDDCDVVKEVVEEEEEGDEEDDEDEEESYRAKSIGFTVHFDDGKVIDERNAKETMIEALRYMGLERASHYTADTFKGFPLVGRNQRITPNGERWQIKVDGWWIYTNLSNERKIRCLNGVASMLNIPLEIVAKGGNDTIDKQDDEQRNKRAMFSLNGGVALCKSRSVLNAVKEFMRQMPNATYKDVCDFFPSQLQGGCGVVRTIDDITVRCSKNSSEERYWFLKPEDILVSADGKSFAVCTQWGNNFAGFQKHVAEQLGWTLEEVK